MKLKRLEKMRSGGTERAQKCSSASRFRRHPKAGSTGIRPMLTPIPGTPGTVCHYSGVRADDEQFMHPDDRKAAMKIVEQAALQDTFSDMLAGVARRSKSLTYKPAPRRTKPRPSFGRRKPSRSSSS